MRRVDGFSNKNGNDVSIYVPERTHTCSFFFSPASDPPSSSDGHVVIHRFLILVVSDDDTILFRFGATL